jgi:class 3 adenylate cyclase/tetratricopeptide (TPR) repeat protein
VPAGQERRLVTVLFADVTGSTALGEQLDPERLRDVMDTFFVAMREEIEAEGGTVEKFIGDAVMAAFGVPVAHEDDPARALRAALRMRRRLEDVNRDLRSRFGVTLEVRTGVNMGEVLATIDPRPGEAMVTGDAVNAAARLEQVAEPGQIVASERTVRAARSFRSTPLGEIELKGKAERVNATLIIGESDGDERGIPGLHAPMVGRERELTLLRSVYERVAAERRPNLVTVYGEAGVGKSRLTHEFLDWARRQTQAPTIVRGRCLPYGDGVTYWPLAEILKGHADVLDTDPPGLVLEKIRTVGRTLLTTEVTPDPDRAAAALAFTVGVEDPSFPFADLEPREVRAESHAAWRSFFSALALDRPLVVVVEDIHWADPALLDLLEELADRIQGGVMFLCPSRPDLIAQRPGWGGGRRNVSSVALEPLSSGDADRLVSLLLAVDELPPTVHARILERAEGNPFFLEEIVRHLIDEGLIVRSGERWRASERIVDVQIPDNVQSVLAARIDLLAPSEKRTLQSAAVVGRVFWPSAVRLLLNGLGTDLAEHLGRLEGRELVQERLGSAMAGETEYIFKHILTRDVAYESLPRRERAQAHVTVARWIEDTAGERAREFVELLAYHYSTAVREWPSGTPHEIRGKAFDALLRASNDARSKLVVKKAQRMAHEAVTLAADDLERSTALDALAQAFFANYEGDMAWRYFREAADARLSAVQGTDARAAYLCARAAEMPTRWPGSMRTVPPAEEVRRYIDAGIARLPEGDSEERVRLLTAHALWPFGYPDYEMGPSELFEMERAGLEAADEALRLGKPNLASGALDAAGGVSGSRGLYGRAVAINERRIDLVPMLTDPLEIGDTFAAMAWCQHEIGRYAEAELVSSRGLDVVGGRAPIASIHLLAWRAVTRYRSGQWDGALEDLAAVQVLLGDRREDPPYFASPCFVAAALVHHWRGDVVEVDRILSYLMPLAVAIDSARLVPWIAKLLIARGDLDQAHRFLSAAPARWRVHAGMFLEGRMELVAAKHDWDATPPSIAEARAHATEAGLLALPMFADRLEGLAVMADGDADQAAELLGRSRDGLAGLDAVFDAALTELDLAIALAHSGKNAEARTTLEAAITTFERLGARALADRARAASSDLA